MIGNSFFSSILSDSAGDWNSGVFRSRGQQFRTLETFAKIYLWPWALILLSCVCVSGGDREKEGD